MYTTVRTKVFKMVKDFWDQGAHGDAADNVSTAWILAKPTRETRALGGDDATSKNALEPRSLAENDEMKQTLMGNHVEENIKESDNVPDQIDDNNHQANGHDDEIHSKYSGEILVNTNQKEIQLGKSAELLTEVFVTTEDARYQLDNTINGYIDETDRNNTENTSKNNAVKMDDKIREEFIPSSSVNRLHHSDHSSQSHQHTDKEVDSSDYGTIAEANNDRRSKADSDEGIETTDTLLECVDSGSDTSTDMEDGFMKLMKMCAGGRAKKIDEDDDLHGFGEQSERKVSRRKKPSFRRSSGVSPISPTPLSTHYKEIKNQSVFDFKITPKQSTTPKAGTQNEVVAQQETGLCSEQVDDDQYNFSFPQRGHMVLIVNDRFRRQSPRDGAKWDLQKTKQIASKFGFRIFNSNHCTNLTKRETISILRQAQNLDHSDSDCFMFVVSTHGLEMPNPRAQGKLDHVLVCSDDQLIFTSNILEMFNDKNCPTLKNKPKIFFIQACRGEKFDTGSEVHVLKTKRNEDSIDVASTNRDRFGRVKPPSVDVTDTRPSGDSWTGTAHAQRGPPIRYPGEARARSPASVEPRFETSDQNLDHSRTYVSRAQIPTGMKITGADDQRFFQTSQLLRENNLKENSYQRPYPINESPSLQCDNDFLVMYAIPPGYFAWRNTADGSWMIDYLYKTVMAYDMNKPVDFLKLLRKVTMRMSARQTNTPSDPRMDQMKAVSVIEHKLVKDIVFKPKAVQSTWLRPDTTFLI